MKFGLDFGTTNSSVSILDNDTVTLLPLDTFTINPEVIRSAVYFHPRKIVIAKTATKEQLSNQEFNLNQISYEGEVKTEIGAGAIKKYLDDNAFRKPGILRKIVTGRTIRVILWTNTTSGKVYTEDILETIEDVDYGTGRLFHALKTALKYPFYKGSTVFGTYYSLEELIGLFIGRLKTAAETRTKTIINEITVGRPVHFSNDGIKDKAAQDRLEKAIKSTGIQRVDFVFEPIGAAKYFLRQKPTLQGKILVFDFGGGTLDTTLVERKFNRLEVLATDGVAIGGDLLNTDIFMNKLSRYFGADVRWSETNLQMPSRFIDTLSSWFGIANLNNSVDMETLRQIKTRGSDPVAIDRLTHLIKANLGFEIYEAVEKAKKELTYHDKAFIVYKDGPIDINKGITRMEFERLIKPRMSEVKRTIARTLNRDSGKPEDLTAVVATGGSSLLPTVRNMLTEIFGGEKVVYFDLFTSIAAGLVL